MNRLSPLTLVAAAGLGLTACATPPAPTQSYIDVAAAPTAEQAVAVEPGRILQVRAIAGPSVAYTVQRLRDDSVIEVDQPDAQPLPTGLRVSIRYGSPVRIEAAPTTPDLG